MKLNKKLTSILVTGAMIASIGGTTAMTSFAASPYTTAVENANLIKYLEKGDQIANPNATFKFDFAKQTFNDKTGDAAAALMPTIPTAEINMAAATATGDVDDEGSVYKAKSFADILNGVTFAQAGEYVYLVTEEKDTYTLNDETMVYDTNAYFIHIYVENVDGTPTVKNITAEKAVATEGEGGAIEYTHDADANGAKVNPGTTDPTVDPDGDKTDEDGDGIPDVVETSDNKVDINGVTFTNTYTKTDKTPTDKDGNPDVDPSKDKLGVLNVSKTVEGATADKSFEFPFTINLTAPVGATTQTPKAAIYKADGTKVKDVTVAYDDDTEFALADGQYLVFTELLAGTTYEVTENLEGSGVSREGAYTPSAVVTNNGTAQEKVGDSTEVKGQDIKTGKYVVDDKNDTKELAAYTNEIKADDEITPTGILMQNAPYILVATLAAGGLVIYLAKRREEEEEA